MIEKMLLNSARKAMLDNIEALDIKTLQKELKKHLQKEFMLEDTLEEVREYVENNSYFKDNVVKTMIFKDYSNGILEILDKVNKEVN